METDIKQHDFKEPIDGEVDKPSHSEVRVHHRFKFHVWELMECRKRQLNKMHLMSSIQTYRKMRSTSQFLKQPLVSLLLSCQNHYTAADGTL